MSANRSQVMGGTPIQAEARAAPNTGYWPTRWVMDRGKSKAGMPTHAKASVLLTKMLLPLQLSGVVRPPDHCVLGTGASMSAKRAEALGGSPHRIEGIAVADTDRSLARWVVQRGKSKAAMLT